MKKCRFHLSTALIVLLVFGAMLGLNMRPDREIIPIRKYHRTIWYPPGPCIHQEHYGWPATMVTRAAPGDYYRNYNEWGASWLPTEYSKLAMAENAALAILICALAISLTNRAMSRRSALTTHAFTQLHSELQLQRTT